MFVAYLSQACNLESLMLDANCMMSSLYENQSLRNMFSIFSTNLSSCYKLKELRVRNSGDVENDDDEVIGTYFSVELLEALLPIINKRRDHLEVLKIDISGVPIGEEHDLEQLRVVERFFQAVLMTTKLHDLKLELSSLPIIPLVRMIDEGMVSSYVYQFNHLKSLNLKLVDVDFGFEQLDGMPVDSLFTPFSNCHSLENINIHFPKEIWDDRGSISTLTKLLKNKSCLKTLALDFNKFGDLDKEVLKLLTDFVEDCKSNKYPQLKAIELGGIKIDKFRPNFIVSPLSEFNNVLNSISGFPWRPSIVYDGDAVDIALRF